MGKNFLLKSCLVLALIMAFCIKAASQSTNDIPKEGNMFYMENGKTRTIMASTRGDGDAQWTFKSVIENCFDSTKVDKDAWMMTADGETKLKVTFKYNTKDERYIIESSKVEFFFYDGDDLFNDDNAELIDDEDITGTFTQEETERSVTLHMTAPKVFPNTINSWYKFYVVIYMRFKGQGTAAVARQIGVSRNGLLLSHGLNGDIKCFWDFREYLLNTTKNYFLNQMFLLDYNPSNTSSFYDNTHVNKVVKNGLLRLSDNLLRAGIASTKYDMVGHSMGGILERLYIQEVDDKHTNRLITLNTPHFGSIYGNVYQIYDFAQSLPELKDNFGVKTFNWALHKAFEKDSSMQAVKDLGEYSPAIKKLGEGRDKLNGIPVFALGSQIENIVNEAIAAKESFFINYPRLASFLFDAKPGKGKNYIEDMLKESDYVVSVESQIGGCDKNCIYHGNFGQAMHCSVTKWDAIFEELNNLLTATTTDEFSTSGFGDAPRFVSTRGEGDDIELIKEIVDPNPGSFIKIEAVEVDDQDYTHEIKLTHSDDMITQVAFCLLSPDEMISDYEKDVMYFDMSGFEGEKWIYAFGRTDYNALVVDSVKVTLGGSGDGIKSVEDDSKLRYAVMGNILKIKNVTGPYSVAIYNYAGQMLTEMKSNPSHTYALPGNKGLLIVSLRSNKGKQFLKVMTK